MSRQKKQRTHISSTIVSYHAARLSAALAESDIDGCLLFHPSNLLGFCGVPLGPSDRLVCAWINQRGEAALVVPAFESSVADGMPIPSEIFAWEEHEDPLDAVIRASELLGIDSGRILLDHNVWIDVRDRLEAGLDRATLLTDRGLIAGIRMRKNADEIEAIRRACADCARVFDAARGALCSTKTEHQLYRLLINRLVDDGARAEIVLVQSGPNAAIPHSPTGTRPFEPGDAVVVDCVCRREGYCGDMTRTFLIGDPNEAIRNAYAAVRHAHDAAIDMIRPGVIAGDVDAIARGIIDRAGFRGAMVHRLGHGIGLDGHEPPYIVQGSNEVLESGMCFTIEPGIYVKDAFGIRLESVVTVTREGCEVLSDLTPLDVACEPALFSI